MAVTQGRPVAGGLPRLIRAGEFTEIHAGDPPWILKPLMCEGSVTMLYGHQGRGKTSLVWQLAVAFVRGTPWMGFRVEKPGPVIFLETDMDHREMQLLLKRAGDSGLLEDGIWLPEAQPDFNILVPAHQAALRSWCDEIEPALVILDTADAGYYAQQENNRLIKRVLERYRRAVEPAGFLFTHHDRKKSKDFFGASSDSDDTSEDSFLGWGQWERAPTATSIQLARTSSDGDCLRFHKHRLGNPGFKVLRLTKNRHGFFEPQHDTQQMLLYWPECLPPEERERVLQEVTSQRDVFRDIAARTGKPFDTVKSQFLRGRQDGAVYDWLELMS